MGESLMYKLTETPGGVPARVVSTGAVDQPLSVVAALAARVIAGVGSCGITVVRGGRPATVASDALAAHLEEAQHAAGDGPGLQALRDNTVIVAADLDTERRWGLFPSVAIARGVRGSLSIPMGVEGKTPGVLNLYASAPHEFSAAERELGELLAGVGATLVRYADQAELSAQLSEALISRAVIEQAKGVIMAQNRCSADTAFDVLRRASQNRNVKLRVVAREIIATVAGRPGD